MPVDEIYMNNTKTLAIVAVLTAATLVIGVTFAATPSAYAAAQKGAQDKKQDPKGKDKVSNNGNTVTEQENKQKGTQSGWDNTFEQEGSNLICTHPEGELFSSTTCQSTD
jgi:hypothetical protein